MGLLLHFFFIYICTYVKVKDIKLRSNPIEIRLNSYYNIYRNKAAIFFCYSVYYLTFQWLNQMQVRKANIQAWMIGGVGRERERKCGGEDTQGFLITDDAVAQ